MHRLYKPIPDRRPKAIARAANDSFTETSEFSVFGRLILVVAIFATAIATFDQLLR